MASDLELLDAPAAPETPVDPPAAPETPAVDPATPLAPTSETPVVDPAAPPAAAPEAEDEDLLAGPEAATQDALTVKALNDKLAKSPELQAAFAKDPGLRNLLYATARQAYQAAQFKEVFQTPGLAKTALDLANRQIEFESAIQGEPAQGLDSLYALTAPRDANGNVDYEQPNAAYSALIVAQREGHLWPYLTKMALDAKDEDLRDAVAIVAMKLGDKIESPSPFAKPAAGTAPREQDPETTARLARLDELEKNQHTQQQQQSVQYQQAVVTGISDSVSKAASSYLDSLLKAKPNVVMTDFIKGVVIEKSVQEVYNLAKDDVSYKNHMNFLFRSSQMKDEALKTKIVAEATKYARERMPKIIAKHIGEASKGIVASQQQRLEKQQGQQGRPEVQGTAGVATPSRQDPAERVKEFIAKNKRRPTDRELLDL